VHKSCVAETCEEKVKKVKVDQQEACSRQSQTVLDQLKHEHVLDKRKAIEEALQLAKKRRQQRLEQTESGQQKSEQRKQLSQQHLLGQWKHMLQGSIQRRQKTEQQGEQQQADEQQQPQIDAVNQQQKPSPQRQQQQPLENESHQHPQNRQAQDQREDGVPQQPAKPVQQPLEQLLQQQQHENPEQMRHDGQQRQIGILQQVPVRRQRSVLRGAAQHQDDNQLPEAPLQPDDANILQQNKPEQQHPHQVPQNVVAGRQNTADEQAEVADWQQEHQSLHQKLQQSGPTDLQQKPEQQEPQQPLVFQAPPLARVNDYKQAVDEWMAKRNIKPPLPDWKLQQMDKNRQQQFEQLQQDKLREQLPNQKGPSFFHHYKSHNNSVLS